MHTPESAENNREGAVTPYLIHSGGSERSRDNNQSQESPREEAHRWGPSPRDW